MTDSQLVNFIIKKRRYPLSFDDYSNFLISLFSPMLIGLGWVMIYFPYCRRGDTIWFLFGGIALILFGVYLAYFTILWLKQNITFFVINNTRQLGITEIAAIVKDNFIVERIKIEKRLHRVTAFTKLFWGQKIMIVLDGPNILVNSRSTNAKQILTLKKDANNIKKLRLLFEG